MWKRDVLAVLTLVSTTACTVGGGPFVGYGTRHGLTWGAEADTGLVIGAGPLVTIGAQSTHSLVYVRGDVGTRYTGLWDTWNGYGVDGRVGLGYGWSAARADDSRGMMFVAGGGPGYAIRSDHRCHAIVAALLSFEVRFSVDELQFVASPRVQAAPPPRCAF